LGARHSSGALHMIMSATKAQITAPLLRAPMSVAQWLSLTVLANVAPRQGERRAE